MKESGDGLSNETGIMTQHTGTQEDISDAMNDIANTVEYLMNEKNESWIKIMSRKYIKKYATI